MRLLTVIVAAAATVGMVSAATARDAAVTTLAMDSSAHASAGSFAPLANAQFSSAGMRAHRRDNLIYTSIWPVFGVFGVVGSIVAVAVTDTNNSSNNVVTCHEGSATGPVTTCPVR